MKRWAVALLWFAVARAVVISDLTRLVDLKHSVVTITETQRLQEVPESSTFAFRAAVPLPLWQCCIGVATLTGPSGRPQRLTPVPGGRPQLQLLGADLRLEGVKRNSGGTVTVQVQYQVGKAVKPWPRRLALMDAQQLLYEESPYAVSPYAIKWQKTEYQFPSNTEILEHPPGLSRQKTGDALRLRLDGIDASPPSGIPQLATVMPRVRLRYIADIPLMHASRVERHVVLSHYRGTSFKDRYWLRNDAANVTGDFNRWELAPLVGGYFVRDRSRAKPHRILFSQDCVLPPSAYDVQYFDEIGNISSSRIARKGSDYTHLTVEPRYPVMGSWAVDWRVEFRTQLTDLLPANYTTEAEHAGRVYVVQVPASPACLWTFAENFVMTVALPHGAEVRSIVVPRSLASHAPEVETLVMKDTWFGMGRPRPLLKFTFGPTTVTDDYQSVLEPIVLTYVYDPVWGVLKAAVNYAALAAATLFTLLLVSNVNSHCD